MTIARPPSERFDEKYIPEPNSGCWIWTDHLDRDGYAPFYVHEKRGPVRAHRFAYERYKGPIPEELQLDHLCRVRCCVNPDHLEPVTNLENHHRSFWATRTHCKHGHEYAAGNLLVLPNGERRCRACQKARMRRWYLEKKKCPT